jgi:hypothetical protein
MLEKQVDLEIHEGLSEKNGMQLDDHDGQGGTACPFDSLASLFKTLTLIKVLK